MNRFLSQYRDKMNESKAFRTMKRRKAFLVYNVFKRMLPILMRERWNN